MPNARYRVWEAFTLFYLGKIISLSAPLRFTFGECEVENGPNHRSVFNILDRLLANQTAAKGVVSIVCWQVDLTDLSVSFLSHRPTKHLVSYRIVNVLYTAS